MDVFLAGFESELSNPDFRAVIKKTNPCGLASFHYANKILEKMIQCFSTFMLDSGAFTFFSNGKHIEWDEYVGSYCDFVIRNNVELFFELDIDALIGYEKVKNIRRRIERETGKQPIPVWHKRLGKDEFINMCEEYPYVAIGGIASREIKPKEHKFFSWFIDEAHKRECKIHGLGFTNLEGLRRYRFDSVDSSTWRCGCKFGELCTFDGKTVLRTKKPLGSRVASAASVNIYNFNEWVKFQQYAKEHL